VVPSRGAHAAGLCRNDFGSSRVFVFTISLNWRGRKYNFASTCGFGRWEGADHDRVGVDIIWHVGSAAFSHLHKKTAQNFVRPTFRGNWRGQMSFHARRCRCLLPRAPFPLALASLVTVTKGSDYLSTLRLSQPTISAQFDNV